MLISNLLQYRFLQNWKSTNRILTDIGNVEKKQENESENIVNQAHKTNADGFRDWVSEFNDHFIHEWNRTVDAESTNQSRNIKNH